MDSQIFKEQLQGSKAFGTQMFKMGLHDPFGHLKNKLWAKSKAGSQIGNLTLDH
jgi:hypothetical protein